MPDPKDYIDSDREYVKGYVRRKEAYPRRRFWFWRLAWYWRLLIFVGVFIGFITLLIISFTTNIYILFGAIAVAIFLFFFLRLVTK